MRWCVYRKVGIVFHISTMMPWYRLSLPVTHEASILTQESARTATSISRS